MSNTYDQLLVAANYNASAALRTAVDKIELLRTCVTVSEQRVAQLEAALEANPQESERLRALIYEALSLIAQGHEPGEYAESVWIAGVVNTLKEVDNGDTNAIPPEP